jgi:hypothetical protein
VGGGLFAFTAASMAGEVLSLGARVAQLERDSRRRTEPLPIAKPASIEVAAIDPIEPTPEDIAEAKALLKAAQDHHFEKRFVEARAIYADIVERHGHTKQAVTARQQLDNLRRP